MSTTTVLSNEIIALNVGGKVFETTRRTLEGDRSGNFFTGLLSGCMSVTRDTKGRLFIDRDPDLFKRVLEYLRTGELGLYDRTAEARVVGELGFYGIEYDLPTHMIDDVRIEEMARDAASSALTLTCEKLVDHITRGIIGVVQGFNQQYACARLDSAEDAWQHSLIYAPQSMSDPDDRRKVMEIVKRAWSKSYATEAEHDFVQRAVQHYENHAKHFTCTDSELFRILDTESAVIVDYARNAQRLSIIIQRLDFYVSRYCSRGIEMTTYTANPVVVPGEDSNVSYGYMARAYTLYRVVHQSFLPGRFDLQSPNMARTMYNLTNYT